MFYHHDFFQRPSPTFLGLDANTWVAIGTFLVVIVALFQDWIRQRWNRSELDLTIKLAPPDCHQIKIGDGLSDRNSIYLRIRVVNVSRNKAENVEVMITKLWKITPESNVIVSTFLPMNLKWSHYGVGSQNIPAGVFKHCDIGPVYPFKNSTVFRFDTIVQPKQVSGGVYPNVIEPGKYRFEIIATGDNADTVTSLWELEFDGTWVESETLMLANHIKIRRLI